MPDWFPSGLSASAGVEPSVVLLRLLTALASGAVVAGIYRGVRRDQASPSLSVTLVLLCVLIAMVSQVVGDNVARAFSLVGALSIVRFRTVVKDTQDTAYVIFAVVVGMAAGTQQLWVAALGIFVIGAAAWAMVKLNFPGPADPAEYLLRLRIPPGQDLAGTFANSIAPCLERHELLSLGTTKGGLFVEVTYRVRLRPAFSVIAAVAAISAAPGIDDIQFRRAGGDEA